MYGKLKNLSIEELEVEIEDLDMCIGKLNEEKNSIMRQIFDLEAKEESIEDQLIGLRALSRMISDLILEKQREEAQ